MTKYKLDDLLSQAPQTDLPLNKARLDEMLDAVLAQPQERASTARIISFPSRVVAGSALTGLMAAMLLLVLNLPVNQQALTLYTEYDLSEEAMLDDVMAADFVLLETLAI